MEVRAAHAQESAAGEVESLAEGLRRRDPAAYAELAARYGRSLHRYLTGALRGDRDLAEDLMVQALAEAARGIGRFDPRRASFTAWLFGIARRLAQLERRRQQRRGAVPPAAQVPLDQIPETAAAGDMAAAVTEVMAAQQCVADLRTHLSDLEMEVLVLHYVHQFSVAEIAGVVRRSGRAVESLLHRARTKARERLEQDA